MAAEKERYINFSLGNRQYKVSSANQVSKAIRMVGNEFYSGLEEQADSIQQRLAMIEDERELAGPGHSSKGHSSKGGHRVRSQEGPEAGSQALPENREGVVGGGLWTAWN